MTNALNMFIDHISNRDLKPRTIAMYSIDTKQFATWFTAQSGSFAPELVTPLDMREWKRHLIAQDYAPGTINNKLSSLGVFFTWCVTSGLSVANPVDDIKRVQQVASAPKWLTRRETYLLLRATAEAVQVAELRHSEYKQRLAIRDTAMIALMLHAGLRVAEVCNLQRDDVKIGQRSGQVIVRQGKGDKRRTVPLNIDARRAVSRWADYQKGVWLFYGDAPGEPVQTMTAQRRIATLGKRAGLIDKLTPHRLRHTFGKSLVDAKVSLDQIAALMGHSNINTTLIYTRPGQADLEKACDLIAWSE